MTEKSISFSIKDWSLNDRPREKLRDKGKTHLSDAELLAILLGSGSKNESAVALSKRILSSVDNNLNAFGKLTIKQLTAFKGIGEAKAISIIAAMELAKRHRNETLVDKEKITSSIAVFNMMRPVIGDLPHEEFWVIYLNNSNAVMQKQQLSKGGITETLVDIRLVLKTALECSAVSLIMIHNHPSGSLQPSKSDILLTQKLKNAAESLDIKVLDHIIITEKAYFSFADEHLL